MKKIAASAAFMLALAGSSGVHAQTATQAVSPEKLQLARQLVEANGGQERAASALKMVMSAVGQSLQKSMPAAQSHLASQIMADVQSEMMGLMPAIMNISEQAYAQDLTEQELRDELAWMQSESGRSIQRKAPMLMQQIVQAEMPLIQAKMPELTVKVLQRVCQEVQCSPKDREVIAAAIKKATAAHSG